MRDKSSLFRLWRQSIDLVDARSQAKAAITNRAFPAWTIAIAPELVAQGSASGRSRFTVDKSAVPKSPSRSEKTPAASPPEKRERSSPRGHASLAIIASTVICTRQLAPYRHRRTQPTTILNSHVGNNSMICRSLLCFLNSTVACVLRTNARAQSLRPCRRSYFARSSRFPATYSST